MSRLTLFPFSTSPFLIFTIFKILKIYVSIINTHNEKNRLYKNYNEIALGITPDDGPMRPKHVVVE
jgi:hypothetical protein